MRTSLRFLMIATAILPSAVDARSARRVAPAPVQGNWCLYYHRGGANCQFGDFQGCMIAAQAYGGNCRLSPSWRARYGDQLPPLERWQYGGTPDYCNKSIDDARCY